MSFSRWLVLSRIWVRRRACASAAVALAPNSPGHLTRWAKSLTRQRRALLQQLFQLGLLRLDPVGVACLIRGPRIGGGLLDQLAEIVADNGNGGIELGEGCSVGHSGTPPWTLELTGFCMHVSGLR